MKRNWTSISAKPGLTEEFIEQNADKVNWRSISQWQKLSEEFIKRNNDKLR